MAETSKTPVTEQRVRLRHEAMTEAKLQLLYAEQAKAVAGNGIMDLHERYMGLSKEASIRRKGLEAQADNLG